MIFDVLNDKNICYAVCVSLNTFIISGDFGGGREYFIVAAAKDKINLPRLKFKNSLDNKAVIIRELNAEEVREFKTINDKFNKVIHSRDGRVYEQVDKSFKKYYADNK